MFELLEAGRQLRPEEQEVRLKGADIVSAEDFPAYYADNLAARLSAAGRYDVAEELFRMSLGMSPSVKRIHFNFGTFLVDRDRSAEALPYLETAARGRKGLAEADLNRGVALSKLGRTAEARKAFERCLRREPKNLMALENLRRLDRNP